MELLINAVEFFVGLGIGMAIGLWGRHELERHHL